jgi:hypothetical protein
VCRLSAAGRAGPKAKAASRAAGEAGAGMWNVRYRNKYFAMLLGSELDLSCFHVVAQGGKPE